MQCCTSIFKTDVRHVFDFLRYCEDKKALLDLVSQETYYQNVSEDVYEVISAYANTKGIVKMEQYKNATGGIDMCKGLRDLINDSKEEGSTEKQNKIIVKMLKKGIPIADICEITECDMEYVEQIRQSM